MHCFKYPDGIRPNLLLLGYILLAYPLAVYGLSTLAWFAPSLLLLVSVLVLSAYLLHDCLHNTIFAAPAHNERLGKLMAALVGAVSCPYAVLRDKHFRHHIERADVLAVNYQALLRKHPLLDRCVRWGCWLHLPAVELLLRWLDLCAPFYLPQRRHLRFRSVRVLATIGCLLLVLYYLSPLAAAGYLAAHLLFLLVLGFMDAFQHSYEVHYRLLGPQQKPAHDRHYEERNTYSNLLSVRFPRVNLLVLNFCYHNVHHQKPSEPWHRLPALHQKCYPEICAQRIPLTAQLSSFHRYRTQRIHPASDGQPTGADGVSFLVGI